MQSDVTKQRKVEDSTTSNAYHSDPSSTNLTPQEQSQSDREANYADHADRVAKKLETDRETLTKDEADKMHSREQKAFGTTEKGGLASQAQKLVAEKEGP